MSQQGFYLALTLFTHEMFEVTQRIARYYEKFKDSGHMLFLALGTNVMNNLSRIYEYRDFNFSIMFFV